MSNKGALALICIYGEDSSDDDVPGPRVSTKRVHKEDEEQNVYKRREKLPLPSELLKQESDDKYMDDPSMHDGRVRSFGHERGNWATYVYITYNNKDTMGLDELLSKIKKVVPSELELKIADDFHISLTRTVILKHHWIQSFMDSIKQQTAYVKKFMVLFDCIKIYCNEERTRTFIGLSVKSGYDSLLKLVEILDKCLVDYRLPTFYEDPSFHMTIAWVVGDLEEELNKNINDINSIFSQLLGAYPQDTWYIYVDHLVCKTGNKSYQFNLC